MSQTINLNPDQVHRMSKELLAGKVCKADMVSLQAAYDACASKHVTPNFIGTPSFVIGEFVVTAGITIGVVCLTHMFGACQ